MYGMLLVSHPPSTCTGAAEPPPGFPPPPGMRRGCLPSALSAVSALLCQDALWGHESKPPPFVLVGESSCKINVKRKTVWPKCILRSIKYGLLLFRASTVSNLDPGGLEEEHVGLL